MNISNLILLIAILLGGLFYFTGITEPKQTAELESSSTSDLSPALRGIPGDYFRNGQRIWIHSKKWLPKGQPKALIFLAHGLSRHSGRWEKLAQRLVDENFAVYAHDAQGFGKSEGDRGYFEDWLYLIDDQLQFVEEVRRSHPHIPTFLLGESMGSITAILSSQRKPQFFKGLILESPPLDLNRDDVPSFVLYIFEKLSEYLPKLPLVPMSANQLSHDEEFVKSIDEDPLAFTSYMRARVFSEIGKNADQILKNAKHIQAPLLILQGTADTLSNPKGAQALYDNVASLDKRLETFEGFGHFLFEEKAAEKATQVTIDWIKEHL